MRNSSDGQITVVLDNSAAGQFRGPLVSVANGPFFLGFLGAEL